MFAFIHNILLGFVHVLPMGVDHIAFIICIFLVSKSWKEMLIFCSTFTLAHSITLLLAATNVVSLASNIVEPIIALTILYSALETIFQRKTSPWKPLILFFFGLMHGLGFASAFSEIQTDSSAFIQGIIGFNLGVELAQLTIMLSLYVTVTRYLSHKKYYHTKIVQPFASCIACLAMFWFIERLF